MNRGVSFSDKPTPRPKTAGGTPSKAHAFTTSKASQPTTGKFAGSRSAASTSSQAAVPSSGRLENSVTTLRSPSTASVASNDVSSVDKRSTRMRTKDPASGKPAQVRRGYQDAKRASDKELQRHLQRLLNQKQAVRRAHDEIANEFSTLSVALDLASDACGGLQDTPESRMLEAMKTSEASTEQVTRQLVSEGFSEEDVSKQLNYVNTLKRHNRLLSDLVIEGGQVLNQLSLKDREVQHLASLVDRACDVDLQCMSDIIGDTVVCNGSPMFPHRTIDDADAVVEEGQNICAKAGRLSLYIRRLVSTGKAEAERSAHDLALAMSIAARVSARKLSSTKREMEGVQFELGRVQLLHKEVMDERTRLQERLDHVSRTIALRETAKDTVFNKGADFVSVALKREREELYMRLDELATRKERFDEELGQLNADLERQNLDLKEYHSKNRAATRIGASVPQSSHGSVSGSTYGGSQAGSRSGSRMGSVQQEPLRMNSSVGALHLQ